MTKEEKMLLAECKRVLERTMTPFFERIDGCIAAMDERVKRWAAEEAGPEISRQDAI